jgi:electron transfer flavoprotein beta subunit
MRILVCLKQVPEKDSRFKIDNAGVSIREEDLAFETNESDQYALEEALRLKEKRGGEVVALSLGPDRVLKSLKNALATGADRAIHIKDPLLQGSDAFGTARVISRVVQKEPFDIVFTGVQSDDLSFGQTGVLLAYFLEWVHATIVIEIEVMSDGKSVRIRRELESNICEDGEIPLPAVLSIQSGINQPRYATLKGIMQAKKKEIQEFTCRDLGLKEQEVGEVASKVQHLRLTFPEKKKKTVMLQGSAEEIATILLEKLRKEAKVL